jgi:hypothetical protein
VRIEQGEKYDLDGRSPSKQDARWLFL